MSSVIVGNDNNGNLSKHISMHSGFQNNKIAITYAIVFRIHNNIYIELDQLHVLIKSLLKAECYFHQY